LFFAGTTVNNWFDPQPTTVGAPAAEDTLTAELSDVGVLFPNKLL